MDSGRGGQHSLVYLADEIWPFGGFSDGNHLHESEKAASLAQLEMEAVGRVLMDQAKQILGRTAGLVGEYRDVDGAPHVPHPGDVSGADRLLDEGYAERLKPPHPSDRVLRQPCLIGVGS